MWKAINVPRTFGSPNSDRNSTTNFVLTNKVILFVIPQNRNSVKKNGCYILFLDVNIYLKDLQNFASTFWKTAYWSVLFHHGFGQKLQLQAVGAYKFPFTFIRGRSAFSIYSAFQRRIECRVSCMVPHQGTWVEKLSRLCATVFSTLIDEKVIFLYCTKECVLQKI